MLSLRFYLLSLCFARCPLTRFHVIVKNMRSFIKLCLVSTSIICINISTFMNSLQSKEKFKQNTCKATNIVSSIVYHHLYNSYDICRKISQSMFKVWIKTILCIGLNFINSSTQKFSFIPYGSNSGPWDFSVSPIPFGLDFGTLDLGLTINKEWNFKS